MSKVTTVKSGKHYRAKIGGVTHTFLRRGDYVQILSPTGELGLYHIDRFGGELSPTGIRKLIAQWT
jgi:hypothetical protein